MSVEFSIIDYGVDSELFLVKSNPILGSAEQLLVGYGEEGREHLVEIAKIIDEYLYPWNESGELPELGLKVEILAPDGRTFLGNTMEFCREIHWWINDRGPHHLCAVVGWRPRRQYEAPNIKRE